MMIMTRADRENRAMSTGRSDNQLFIPSRMIMQCNIGRVHFHSARWAVASAQNILR